MDKKLFTVPAAMTSYKSMSNNALRMTYDTQESLTPDTLQRLLENHNKVGHLLFAVEQIEFDDLNGLSKIDTSLYKDSKTPSQRLRAALFVRWSQLGKKGDFDVYYKKSMEFFIDQVKEKLEDGE